MQMEKGMWNFQKQAQPEPSVVEKNNPKSASKHPTGNALEQPKGPKFSSYTPLNVLRVKILKEAFSVDSLPPPRKMPPSPNFDGSKHCLYHRNIGHTTEQCHTLCDKIEELIRTGQLKRYVHKE